MRWISDTYIPGQKSLAHLDQIAWKCVDKLFWKQSVMTSLEKGTPPPQPTMLKTSNDGFITINNIELGAWGRTDKFPRQMLQKWAIVPRLLSGIVVWLSWGIYFFVKKVIEKIWFACQWKLHVVLLPSPLLISFGPVFFGSLWDLIGKKWFI